MPARLRASGLLLAALFALPAVLAAGPGIKFGRLTMSEGLPEDGALQVLQDRTGFLWIGTHNGLARYDGNHFTVFKPDPEDPGSIGGRIVMALYEDRDGTLWVGTRRGGLNRFEPATQSFVRYVHDPSDPASLSHDAVGAIFEDSRGDLWVGTGDIESQSPEGGLNRLDRDTGTFLRFLHQPQNPTSLSYNVITSIAEDRDGLLWIGTAGGGLNRFDPAARAFTRYLHDDTDRDSLGSNWVAALAVDARGALWVGTAAGLDRLEPGGERFTHFRSDPGSRGGLADDKISCLYVDLDGALWVGTWKGILHRFRPETSTFTRYAHDPEDPHSLTANNGILSIVRDRSEVLWVGTWRGGLNKLDRFAGKFPHFEHDPDEPNSLSHDRVSAFAEDRAGNLWVGTRGGGLNRFNRASGTYTHFRHDEQDPGSLSSDWVSAVLEDSDGVLWVGTRDGLDRFDPGTGTFTHYRHDPEDPESLGHHWVLALEEDRAGYLWVGTLEGGVSRLDRAGGRFTRYPDKTDPASGPSHNIVRAIYEDSRGVLWLATEAGLDRLDRDSGEFTSYFDPATGLDIVWDLLEDRAGRLWIGTFNGGLHLFDRDSGTSRAFTQRQGLAHDSVFHILEDDDGKLWLSTGFGLSRFDPDTETFRNYDRGDGLASHQFDGGAIRTREGELLFGSANGVNAFFPRHVEDSPYQPPVVLTGFYLFGEPVDPGEGSPLERHISQTEVITLPHDRNMVAFEFAALHYGRPEKNRFAVRLEPLDAGWRHTGNHNHAAYTSLEPGRYTFHVKAANADGVWNEQGTSVRLTIRPPWWRTGWAYAGYGLLVIGLVASADRIQRRRLVARERTRAREEQARLRTEAAELQAQAAEAQARALQAENERQTAELEDARRLQLSLLPEALPEHPDLEIAAYMKTATEVGGDFYDFDVGDVGELTVAIGDATGHGMRAGNLVTATKVLFQLLARRASGVELLRESTRVLRGLHLHNLFMALTIARFENHRLVVAGAGMPPVLVRRAASGGVEEIDSKGAPLGSFPDFPYEAAAADLEPGDAIVLMSDGLPEMLDPDGEVFGYERVEAELRAAPNGTAQAIIDRLSESAERWAGGRPQDDDLTLVVLRLRG